MLYNTQSTVITMGDYTDDELIEGYSIQLFDDYDNSFGAADGIMAQPGDTLTLFMFGGILVWSLDGSFTQAGDQGGAPNHDDPIYADDSHELAGTWYLDGDYSNPFFVIDANGDWKYYSPTTGDSEGELLDYGCTEAGGDFRYVLLSDTEDASYEIFWLDPDILTFSNDYGDSMYTYSR